MLSVNFMMTILDRPRHILIYSCPFEVFFCVIGKLAEKATIHSYTLETKISFYLREDRLQSRQLDYEKHSKSHIKQNNLINSFLPLYIEETNKSYMHQRIKWAQRQAWSPSVNIFIFPFEFSNSGNLGHLRLYFKSQPNF